MTNKDEKVEKLVARVFERLPKEARDGTFSSEVWEKLNTGANEIRDYLKKNHSANVAQKELAMMLLSLSFDSWDTAVTRTKTYLSKYPSSWNIYFPVLCKEGVCVNTSNRPFGIISQDDDTLLLNTLEKDRKKFPFFKDTSKRQYFIRLQGTGHLFGFPEDLLFQETAMSATFLGVILRAYNVFGGLSDHNVAHKPVHSAIVVQRDGSEYFNAPLDGGPLQSLQKLHFTEKADEILNHKTLLSMSSFLRKVLPIDSSEASKELKHLIVASEWLAAAEASDNKTFELVQVAVAYETLLGGSGGIGKQRGDLSRQLADRFAYLLVRVPELRSSWAAKFSEFYKLRSDVVHGAVHRLTEEHEALVRVFEDAFDQILKSEIGALMDSANRRNKS